MHGLAEEQLPLAPLTECQKVVAVAQVGAARGQGARVQNDVALSVQHQHIARARRSGGSAHTSGRATSRATPSRDLSNESSDQARLCSMVRARLELVCTA